jgi:hypothetical protein
MSAHVKVAVLESGMLTWYADCMQAWGKQAEYNQTL